MNDPKVEEVKTDVLGYIKKVKSDFTFEDLIAGTGRPTIEAKIALDQLAGDYDCRLKVTEQGNLLYDFGASLKRRSSISLKERLGIIASWLWKGFTLFYKFLTSIILIVYFVFFLIALLAMIAASMRGNNNRSGADGLFRLVYVVFRGIFIWDSVNRNQYDYNRDRRGYRYKEYDARKGVLSTKNSEPQKSFIASIYDFIFGQPRFKRSPLANRMEVATYLRQSKGLVTISEIQALAGWTREEASSFISECLYAFEGEAKVSDNGTLYGDFSDLLRTKAEVDPEPVIWYWDEYTPPYNLNDNSSAHNSWIVFMNIFNLMGSSFLIANFPNFGLPSILWWLVGFFPFIYSVLFFMIPLGRYIINLQKNRSQYRENVRKRVMRAIFQIDKKRIPLPELVQYANQHNSGESPLSEKEVEQIMKDTIYDLGGEVVIEGQYDQYEFVSLHDELVDIHRLREGKMSGNSDDKIVFEA